MSPASYIAALGLFIGAVVRAEEVPLPPVAGLCRPVDFSVSRVVFETVGGCFESKSTKGTVRYEVTFPAGYDPAKREPFVVFLHGRGGNEAQFREFGGAEALDAHVKKGGAPFVVVAPGEPTHSYWKDGPNGEFGTATMVSEDLVKHVEGMPGIQAGDRSRRAIMGISMGGHGSFFLAETKPEVFSAVYAMSPVFRGSEELLEEDLRAFGKDAAYRAQDPVGLYLERTDGKENPFGNMRKGVEIGKDDYFLTESPRTKEFITKLKADLGEENVNMSRPGGHDAEYWQDAFKRASDFMGDNFTTREPRSFRPGGNCAATFGTLGPAINSRPGP